MNKFFTLFAVMSILVLAAGAALAHTVTLTWTWPIVRQDGTALAPSEIGSITIYDTSQPAPGLPGTVISCPAGTLPPASPTGTCTTDTLPAGNHGFVAVVTDNSTPPQVGEVSMAVSVVVPLSGPGPVTNFSATLN